MKLEHIEWDSHFFDLEIGRIICNNNVDESELKATINIAKQNYSLLYVVTPENNELNIKFVTDNGGKLVDKKIVYMLDIGDNNIESYSNIYDITGDKLNDNLLELTYLSGQYSRFLLDKQMPVNAFERLYQEWIEKSLSRELADKVFVYSEDDKILGFITIRIKENIGEIGLIAVSELVQGKRIGSKLIDTCINYLKQNSINQLTVPTQLPNNLACKFYEKYGFKKLSITNIYHFWL